MSDHSAEIVRRLAALEELARKPQAETPITVVFTPTLSGSGTPGTFTYTTQSGRATRDGNRCKGAIQIIISAIGTPPTGTLQINNLPYAAASGATYEGHITIGFLSQITLLAGTRIVGGTITNGATFINLTESPSAGAASNLPASALGATANIVIGFDYETA